MNIRELPVKVYNRLVYYLIRGSSFRYRLYASVDRKIRHKRIKYEAYSNNYKSAESIIGFTDLLYELDRNKAIIYGREIIEKYRDEPGRSVLLVSHDLSFTGAPIVLLYMAWKLKQLGYQVIVASPFDGHILALNALEKDIPVVVFDGLLKTDIVYKSAKLFSYIIANTIITAPVIRQLNNTDNKVIWWIHESIACYSRQTIKTMPDTLEDNIRVFTVGAYAKRVLNKRYPKYKLDDLIYYSPDISKSVFQHEYSLGGGSIFDDGIISYRCGVGKTYAIVCSMIRRKGVDILIRAIKELPKDVVLSCRFIFAGKLLDRYIKTKLYALKKKYPDHIIITGELPLNRIHQLYSDIDYLICPSRDDPMPVVIAEAMSVGKPCICSENTGSAVLIRRYGSGYVYRFNSPRRLKNAIEKTYYLPDDRYEVLSRNARKVYEREFSEEIFDKRIRRILDINEQKG